MNSVILAALLATAPQQDLSMGDIGPFGVKVTPDQSRLLVPMFGAFSPHRILGRTVKVVDPAAAAVVKTLTVGLQPEDLDFTRDGRFAFVTNSSSSSVSVIDLGSMTVVSTTRIGAPFRTFLFGVAVSPDGSRAIVNTSDGNYDRSEQNMIVLDADPASPTFAQVVERITITGGFSRPAFRSNGMLVNPRGFADNNYSAHPRISQFSGSALASETVIVPAPGGSHGVEDVAVTPNGRYAYAPVFNFDQAQGSDEVYVVDLETSSLVDIITLGSNDVKQHGAAISPNGLLVAVTNYTAGTVSLIYTPTNSVIRTIPVGAQPNEVSFTADSRTMYVSNQGSSSVSVVSLPSAYALTIDLISTGVIQPDIGEQIQAIIGSIDYYGPQYFTDLIRAIIDGSRNGTVSLGTPKNLDPPSEGLNGISVPQGGLDSSGSYQP